MAKLHELKEKEEKVQNQNEQCCETNTPDLPNPSGIGRSLAETKIESREMLDVNVHSKTSDIDQVDGYCIDKMNVQQKSEDFKELLYETKSNFEDIEEKSDLCHSNGSDEYLESQMILDDTAYSTDNDMLRTRDETIDHWSSSKCNKNREQNTSPMKNTQQSSNINKDGNATLYPDCLGNTIENSLNVIVMFFCIIVRSLGMKGTKKALVLMLCLHLCDPMECDQNIPERRLEIINSKENKPPDIEEIAFVESGKEVLSVKSKMEWRTRNVIVSKSEKIYVMRIPRTDGEVTLDEMVLNANMKETLSFEKMRLVYKIKKAIDCFEEMHFVALDLLPCQLLPIMHKGVRSLGMKGTKKALVLMLCLHLCDPMECDQNIPERRLQTIDFKENKPPDIEDIAFVIVFGKGNDESKSSGQQSEHCLDCYKKGYVYVIITEMSLTICSWCGIVYFMCLAAWHIHTLWEKDMLWKIDMLWKKRRLKENVKKSSFKCCVSTIQMAHSVKDIKYGSIHKEEDDAAIPACYNQGEETERSCFGKDISSLVKVILGRHFLMEEVDMPVVYHSDCNNCWLGGNLKFRCSDLDKEETALSVLGVSRFQQENENCSQSKTVIRSFEARNNILIAFWKENSEMDQYCMKDTLEYSLDSFCKPKKLLCHVIEREKEVQQFFSGRYLGFRSAQTLLLLTRKISDKHNNRLQIQLCKEALKCFLRMEKQDMSEISKFYGRSTIKADSSPHDCQSCKALHRSIGQMFCLQEKHKVVAQEFIEDFTLNLNEVDKTYEDNDILLIEGNIVDVHFRVGRNDHTWTENEDNIFKTLLEKEISGVNGKNCHYSEFGFRQPAHLSMALKEENITYDVKRVGKHQPLYDRNTMEKLRVQVIPNQNRQLEEQSNVKSVNIDFTVAKSRKISKSNNTFLNNKNDIVHEEKSTKKNCSLLIREITWISITDLPMPVIDLTVAHITQFEPLMEIIDLIAAGTPPTPHVSMRYELLRFCTLRSYPKGDKPFIIMLAEAGFYYASDGDGVVCYCCGVRRYNWTAEDIPRKVHERINPSCKFLRKNEEVNVPVQYFGPFSKELMAIMDIPEPVERPEVSEDVNNDWAPERVRAPESQNRPNQSGTNALGINTAIPKHSQYATKTAREASYTSWPVTSSHTPHDLADAGFFYAGFGDCVRCFYCGIGLRHWTSEDDAWIEHARWSRNCVFVKQKKGEEFINLVQMAVQYAQDNENNTSGQGPQQIQEIERLLLSDPAQSVLGMGYQPRIIKQAIEHIMNQNASAKITSQLLMEKVLEIESSSNQPTATAAATPAATAKSEKAKPEVKKPEQGKKPAPKNNPEKKPEKSEPSNEGNDKDKGEEDDSQQDPKAIKRENEELKEQTLCKVCLDNTVSIVFLPCGHLVTCADCAPAMRKCPICRALVKGTVRTYMS